MPTRRTHTKSKKGCAGCKKQHLKCDEALPVCTKCRSTGRVCQYPPSVRLPSGGDTSLNRGTPSSSSQSGANASFQGGSTPVHHQQHQQQQHSITHMSATSQSQSDAYTIRHFQLLHHFDQMMLMSTSPAGVQRRKILMGLAVGFPFLLNQMLALAAANMSASEQSRHATSAGATEATDLQTRALAQFNAWQTAVSDAQKETTKEESLAAFTYSSLLGMHVMFDTFSRRPTGDFNAFLDQLTSCFSMQQGVPALISMPGTWEVVKTHLSLFMGDCPVEEFTAPVTEDERGDECDALALLLDQASLGAERLQTCRDAVSSLQWAFDVQRRIARRHSQHNVLAVLAWKSRLSSQFINMLRQRTPEALLVLGYYAVLLHWSAAHWAVGDAGRFVATSISGYLGSYWEEWLSWPLQVVRIDTTDRII